MRTTGNAAIVTGGASGLGLAVVELLRRKGCDVVILDFDQAAGQRAAIATGALFITTDVSCEQSIDAAIAQAEQAQGIARICVNCAGIGPAERAVSDELIPHSVDNFRRTLDINLVGSFVVATRFAARLMTVTRDEEERGVIINTASIAARDGIVGQAGYAASKAGVNGLTLPLAREFAPHAIRVVTIEPGIFSTPMLDRDHSTAVQNTLGAQVPFPARLGHPAEFADLVCSIIGNAMINGTSIRLDGAARLAGFDLARLQQA